MNLIEGGAHRPDGEGAGHAELGKYDAGHLVSDGDDPLHHLTQGGLKQYQQTQANHQRRQDNGDVQDGIHKGLTGKSIAGEKISDGNRHPK